MFRVSFPRCFGSVPTTCVQPLVPMRKCGARPLNSDF